MAKEYIEREALMNFPIRIDHYDKEHGNEHFVLGIESVLEYAENLPAADVVEVVHAYWTGRLPSDNSFAEGYASWFTEEDKRAYDEYEAHKTHCSNCKAGYDDRDIHDVYYCKFCGAKMDK